MRDEDKTHVQDDDATLDAPVPSSQVTVPSLPAAPAMPDSDLARGAVLGDYRIEHKIGRGGMGDVYLAKHTVIGKRAAIKILRGDSEPEAVRRFVAEAQVVNEIHNSNIVDVFAFGTAPDGRAYLVMEWLQGETLRQRLQLGKLDVETACRIARQLVRALGAAHGKRIVHRDVKPDNVFLVAGEDLTVKLLDFGMAKLLRMDRMTQTASGAFVGTPMYVAPEQARGLTIDHRADIYTLGGVLFEMLTGRPPFVAKSAFEVISMHMTEPAPRPGAYVQVPAELDELVESMLAKEPAVRPPLGKVAEVLERMIDPGDRPTTPHEAARESVLSIAKTNKRPLTPLREELTPAAKPALPIWLLVVVAVLGAAGAFALVRGLLG
ncbi:MAG: serine/threonine protein kinase [Deltaproteobacteria bacterium]|nr:serine/threonine protein kinase [Deltaproteobacteria bacterium]